jgi:3',5'-cyclic AMP phosphodiesterase CpdA
LNRLAVLGGLLAVGWLAVPAGLAWTARDVLPVPNYADDFSPMPSLPPGEALRIQEIKFPVQGRPVLLRPGDELRVVVDLDKDPASANMSLVSLRLRSHRPALRSVLDLSSGATVTEDLAENLFLVTALLPTSGVAYDLYDLELEAVSGADSYSDVQPRCVKVLDRFRDSYTFVHLSDVHQGDPRGTADNRYPQEIIDGIVRTLNFVQPEFVVISGDLAYGEEYFNEFPDSMRTFDRALFPTFAVPGNHDAQRNVFGAPINDGRDYFRGFWGPPYHSFDYGPLHLVGLDSMDRPRADRRIGLDSEGVHADFWGGIDLHDGSGGMIPEPQMDWLEADLEQASQRGQASVLYLHHDPTKDFTPGLPTHDVWNFADPEYAESSDRLRAMFSGFGVGHLLVGHDHYDEVREVLGTQVVMTTTAASERRFGSYWGYRLFRVEDGKIVSLNYVKAPDSVPYGFAEDSNEPDVLTPYLDWSFVGPNDGSGASEAASVRNSLAEPMAGRLEFFVSGSGNQASRGAILQELPVPGAVRVLVELTAPPGQTVLVRVRPASVPPPAPTGLVARVTQSSIRLRWDPVLDTDLRGYKVAWLALERGGGSASFMHPAGPVPFDSAQGTEARQLAERSRSQPGRQMAGAMHEAGGSTGGEVELQLQDLADPQHPAYEIQGLEQGYTYQVRVSAFDASAEGPAALSPLLTPHAPPPHPTGLRAVAGDRFLDLSFTQPGSAAGWLVHYGSGPGDALFGTDAAEGPSPIRVQTTRVRLSGLSNGTIYRVAVSALDAASGESPLSNVVRAMPERFASADLDADGLVDAADRSALLRMQASLAAVDGTAPLVADLNGNRRVDLGDAALAGALVAGRNTPPLVRVRVTPPALAAGVEATYDAASSLDREDLPSALQFRFDFEGDGAFTPWGLAAQAVHTYPDARPRQVVVEARDSAGLVGRAVVRYLPRIASHLFLVDIDGCRRDVFYRALTGASGHSALRDDLLGRIGFGGTNADAADFTGSAALGADRCRALFPTVTFTNQAAIPMGQHARVHGIAGNEFFDRDLLFERSFVAGDAQAVYTEGKALATLAPGARAIYQDAAEHGLDSAVIFHQYPKGAGSYVSQTTPEFAAFLLDPAQAYDQLSFYRAVEELVARDFPPLAYLYLAGLDHRSHLEGIESQADQLSVLDSFFETFVHGGTFEYPDITLPSGSTPPIPFAGLENLPDPLTPDPNDSILDNSVFCFTADHGQINYGDDILDIANLDVALKQYFDPQAVVEGEPPKETQAFEPLTGLKDSETLRNATVVAEFNGPSMFLYVKNRARGTWDGYPDFEADVLPLARAMARANTDGRADNFRDGAIRDIVVRRTGKSGGREYSEGYLGYGWDGQTDRLVELEDFFPASLVQGTNIIEHLRGLESRRSGDVILTVGRDPAAQDEDRTGWNFGLPFLSVSIGQHGDWTPGESLIPQVCGGPPVRRLGLARTEAWTSQLDFAPTAAQFLGISMASSDGRGYLYPFGPEPLRYPDASVALGGGAATPGQLVSLPLRLAGGAGVTALQATLRFDSKRLALAAVQPADVSLVDSAVRAGIGSGRLAALFEPLPGSAATALRVSLRVAGSAPAGPALVAIEAVQVADAGGLVQTVPASGTVVQILPAPPVPAAGLAAVLVLALAGAFVLARGKPLDSGPSPGVRADARCSGA